ncbi:MAG TPA: beta-ketoacyl-ACP synthase I [Thermohalobaculum sp.]|nr:beta-ketoacyl-ACP synthase I [Thermohalobaculum sp.]
MRRVVITGIGIVSSIGGDAGEVTAALREGRSGIVFAPEYAERGFRCQVHGKPNVDIEALVDKRVRRFMGDGAAWNFIAMEQAISDAGLGEAEVSHERTGLIMGSGGPSTRSLFEANSIVVEKGSTRRIGPFAVPKAMSSTNSATLATPFRIKGVNYSITSACSTSAHCIGNAVELIQWGKQDVIFAGGGEELDWTLSCLFDAMGAMSTHFNDTPERASRAYDKDRDGFVIAGGAGVVVLEELERARARGAKIYAEVTGYGANSDGFDMVQPSGEGAVRCMKQAIAGLRERKVDYINTHGTSTPVGDEREVGAIREVFGAAMPHFSSTKSLTGHSLGATGAQEAIYCMLMLAGDFIAASANVETLDPQFEGAPVVTRRIDDAGLDTVISNSFGFGGTNCTLALSRYHG